MDRKASTLGGFFFSVFLGFPREGDDIIASVLEILPYDFLWDESDCTNVSFVGRPAACKTRRLLSGSLIIKYGIIVTTKTVGQMGITVY